MSASVDVCSKLWC